MSDPVPFSVTSADGTRIDGLAYGEGRPIVVAHGGMQAAALWADVAAALQGYRLLAFDRRVYGRSGTPQSPHSVAREIDDIAAVVAFAGPRPLLLGHSSGGVMSLEAALRIGASLSGLILYEPPVSTDTPLGNGAQALAEAAIRDGDPGRALTIHFERMVGMPDVIVAAMGHGPMWEAMVADAPAQIIDNRAIIDLGLGVERYRAITLPTLLIEGADSPAHLLERSAALAAVIPNAVAVRLAGEGHIANLTAPALLAETIDRFAAPLARAAA